MLRQAWPVCRACSRPTSVTCARLTATSALFLSSKRILPWYAACDSAITIPTIASTAKTASAACGPNHAPMPASSFTSPPPTAPSAYNMNVSVNPARHPSIALPGETSACGMKLCAIPLRTSVNVSQFGIRRVRQSMTAATASIATTGAHIRSVYVFTSVPHVSRGRRAPYAASVRPARTLAYHSRRSLAAQAVVDRLPLRQHLIADRRDGDDGADDD